MNQINFMHLTIHRKPIRSLRIRVLPDGSVIVSVPKRLSDAAIERFIESKKPWIEKALEKMRKGKERLVVGEGEILLFGIGYKFVYEPHLKRGLFVDHLLHTITTGEDLTVATKLKKRYKEYAKDYLAEKLGELAQRYKLHYEKLYIRDQKTKWGTCSTKKNIGLNRKLIKMPAEIIEYVICHELAHLKEMNHSKRFWAVVEELYPDYKEAMKRVKRYGGSLQ
ncbi:M48 family metallopeptidase [Candidatus Gracilibacteria bacterium]|nr:M48 family metallopeptidase [Candidatus Gracilibacteria bacterium]